MNNKTSLVRAAPTLDSPELVCVLIKNLERERSNGVLIRERARERE